MREIPLTQGKVPVTTHHEGEAARAYDRAA
jgi:hypothetical protein